VCVCVCVCVCVLSSSVYGPLFCCTAVIRILTATV
jgi:hypothetical protein